MAAEKIKSLVLHRRAFPWKLFRRLFYFVEYIWNARLMSRMFSPMALDDVPFLPPRFAARRLVPKRWKIKLASGFFNEKFFERLFDRLDGNQTAARCMNAFSRLKYLHPKSAPNLPTETSNSSHFLESWINSTFSFSPFNLAAWFLYYFEYGFAMFWKLGIKKNRRNEISLILSVCKTRFWLRFLQTVFDINNKSFGK